MEALCSTRCLMQICQLISLNSVSVCGKWIWNDCQIICLACLAGVWNGTLLMCYYSVSLSHTNDWKVNLYVYHGAQLREHAAANDATKDKMNHSFWISILQLHVLTSETWHLNLWRIMRQSLNLENTLLHCVNG